MVVAMAGFAWFSIAHSNHQAARLDRSNALADEDDRLILATVTPAMMAHAPRWTRIPVTLSDEDYALLAIRYGITSSDRNAIKRRILEDLNDFSGNSEVKKAA